MSSENAGAMPSSSVVVRGLDATTFSEMESFVKDLESRPIERLIRDLAAFTNLSGTKFSLVSYVIASKFKQEAAEARPAVLESIAASIESAEGEARSRMQSILFRLR
jgi:hypothetical protein